MNVVALLLVLSTCTAWKWPWDANHIFVPNQKVDLLVNYAHSEVNEEQIAYYKLPFVCPASSNASPVHLSIAEILNGDRFWQSDYRLSFEVDTPCARICDRIISSKTARRVVDMIKDDYMLEWAIDGIPGATTLIDDDENGKPRKFYVRGFPMGFIEDGVGYLHNHVMMVIRWHKEFDDPNKKTIVGFEVYPKSVSDSHCPGASRNYNRFKIDLDQDKLLIPFTYSVYWREDKEVNFNSRWKLYVDPSAASDTKVHWIAIVNSVVLISLLSLFAAFIILRTVYASDSNDDGQPWRRISGDDVFVEPKYLSLLCILSGSGVQLIFTILGFAVLLLFGLNRTDTTVLSTMGVLLTVGGFFSGFSAVQQYKIFSSTGVTMRRAIVISTVSATLLMFLALVATVVPNLFVYSKNSPRFIKFGSLVVMFFIYILLQIPVSILGGMLSLRMDYLKLVVSSVPQCQRREVKSPAGKPFYNRFPLNLALFGLFPFGIAFIELLFLYKSVFVNRASSGYLYGFILFSAVLLLVVQVENGVISTFLRLNAGDAAHWQWRSLVVSMLSIWVYLEAYSLYYLMFRMKMIDLGSPLLFIVYATTFNVAVAVACGAIGVWSSTLFVYKVYGPHKRD